MTTVENYYKGMAKDADWMKPDQDQETIIALKAQIDAKKVRKGGRQTKETDWHTVPPKSGASKVKVVTINGKQVTYFWYPYHQRWTIHKPNACQLHLQQQTQDEKSNVSESKLEGLTPKAIGKKDDKGLALRVMNAVLDESDSDCQQEDETKNEEQDSK